MKNMYLVLADGTVFKGLSCGADKEVQGEVVFNTSMTGYLESLSDPSYTGQILVQSFPLIGNYGTIKNDMESTKFHVSGYIVKELCDGPSNFRNEGNLAEMLKRQGIPTICGIDTRTLVKRIREYGVINGMITDDPVNCDLKKLRELSFNEVVSKASVMNKFPVNSLGKYKVALIDFGFKKNILNSLISRNIAVTIFPHNFSSEEILLSSFDGIVLSNGPGDPIDNKSAISNIEILMNSNIPMFGICLGHQLMALAMAGKTEKLKYGHRGANHPVKSLIDGRIYITSQNHGFAVSLDKLPDNSLVTFINLNDNTCEGLNYLYKPAFSVQFHPEACPGPKDTEFLFDDFIKMMETIKSKKNINN